jgi:hypothetical protein
MNKLFGIVLLALLSACANTHLNSVWRDPERGVQPLRKVAVFVFADDETQRRFAEDLTARSLPRSARAVPSHTLFPKGEIDIARIKARLSAEGFDGAYVSRLVSVDKNTHYIPPQTQVIPTMAPTYSWSPTAPHTRTFSGFIEYAQVYTTPGYMTESTVYVVENLVYALPEGKPIWSGVTETVNPGSRYDLVKDIQRLVIRELEQAGIIQPDKP